MSDCSPDFSVPAKEARRTSTGRHRFAGGGAVRWARAIAKPRTCVGSSLRSALGVSPLTRPRRCPRPFRGGERCTRRCSPLVATRAADSSSVIQCAARKRLRHRDGQPAFGLGWWNGGALSHALQGHYCLADRIIAGPFEPCLPDTADTEIHSGPPTVSNRARPRAVAR